MQHQCRPATNARRFVGARTLESDDKPPSGEAGEGLEGAGVRVLVVPGAGTP